MSKPILCLDFDGVCHLYISRWESSTIIPDPPVDGLYEFLIKSSKYFQIYIYSSRSDTSEGIESMKEWFNKYFNNIVELLPINFCSKKPPAFVTLDDRAIQFNGIWPDIESLINFKPWNKKMKRFEELDAHAAFKYWGGFPEVLSSRSFFAANATQKDKRAIIKLTEQQFKQLNWEPPLASQYGLDLTREIL